METYKRLASTLDALANCRRAKNDEWAARHVASIKKIMQNAPSGSGIDSGTALDFKHSSGEKLVFGTSYHHMDENGMYDGWTEHEVVVTPSLQFGINIRITGPNRNAIKDYLYEIYEEWLLEEEEKPDVQPI